jgi:hypothetical protein
MGKNKAADYGIRNSGEGAVLVRIKPKRIIAENNCRERNSKLGLIHQGYSQN